MLDKIYSKVAHPVKQQRIDVVYYSKKSITNKNKLSKVFQQKLDQFAFH